MDLKKFSISIKKGIIVKARRGHFKGTGWTVESVEQGFQRWG